MAYLDVAGDSLLLHLSLFERLGGFVRGDAQIPLTSVRHARTTRDPWGELRGMRMPGTQVGRRAIGSWRFAGGKDFVAIRGRGEAVVVELAGVEYARLIVTTRGSELIAAEINTAAARARDPTAPPPAPVEPYA